MKTTHILLIALLLLSQLTFGQFVHFHTHINNNDANTRTKLFALKAILAGRNATVIASNKQLKDALKAHEEQIKLQYTKNTFDKGTGFRLSASLSAAASATTSAIARIPNLPYMTAIKQNYLDAVTKDKLLLLSLENVSKSKIKSSKRQEIYRLRSKLLREFSKHDRDTRSTLFISAAGVAVLNIKNYSLFKLPYKAF